MRKRYVTRRFIFASTASRSPSLHHKRKGEGCPLSRKRQPMSSCCVAGGWLMMGLGFRILRLCILFKELSSSCFDVTSASTSGATMLYSATARKAQRPTLLREQQYNRPPPRLQHRAPCPSHSRGARVVHASAYCSISPFHILHRIQSITKDDDECTRIPCRG